MSVKIRNPSHRTIFPTPEEVLAKLWSGRSRGVSHARAPLEIIPSAAPLPPLPEEIWLDVFMRLDHPMDVARCRQVNRRFAELAADNQIWKRFLPSLPKDVEEDTNMLGVLLKTSPVERRWVEMLWRHLPAKGFDIRQPVLSPDVIVSFARRRLSDSRFVAHAAAQHNPRILRMFDDSIKHDLELMLPFVSKYPDLVNCLGPELTLGKEALLKVLRQAPRALEYAAPGLRADREVVMCAVQTDGEALLSAAETLQRDPEIVRVACRTWGGALEYASVAMCDDKDIVMNLLKNIDLWNMHALRYASVRLRDDDDVALRAVKRLGSTLRHLSDRLRDRKRIVLLAVNDCPSALQYASQRLRADREVVEHAVKLDGDVLRYASAELLDDPYMKNLQAEYRVALNAMFLRIGQRSHRTIEQLIYAHHHRLSDSAFDHVIELGRLPQ